MKNKRLYLLPILLGSLIAGCGVAGNSGQSSKPISKPGEISNPNVSTNKPNESSNNQVSTSVKNIYSLEVSFVNGGVFILNDVFTEDLIRVYAYYEDGTKDIIPTGDCTFDAPDLTTTGTKIFTVSYAGITASCNIDVFEVYSFETAHFGGDEDAPDKDYLYENVGTGRNNFGHRFADENAYWTYKFSLDYGYKYSEMIFKGVLSNEFLISVSLDNQNWYDLAQGGIGEGNRTEDNDVSINFVDDFMVFAENHGNIYFRFKDANELDGYGAILEDFIIYYTAEVDENPLPEVPVVQNKIKFKTASEDEAQYLFNEYATGTVENTKRFADENAYFIYKFDLEESVSDISLNLSIENQSKIEVSFDGKNYVEVANSISENANDCGKYYSTDILSVNVPATVGNEGEVYVRFSDADPSDGFGCCLYSFEIEWTYGEGTVVVEPTPEPEPEPEGPKSLSFKVATEEETSYLFENERTGTIENTKRFADETSYFIYKFDLEESVSNITLNLVIENESKVEVSYDNETYYEVANSVKENANGNGRYYSNVTKTININAYTNTGEVYIKFSDAKPTDGFGCCLYSFEMTWEFGEGTVPSEPEKPVVLSNVTFNAATEDETPHLFENVGTGTVNNSKRWADNNSYFVYKFAIDESATKLILNLIIENESKIEISFNGQDYVEIANSVSENANGNGRYFSNVTNTFETSLEGNSGELYIRFSDAKTADGFGCCLYSFNMVVE